MIEGRTGGRGGDTGGRGGDDGAGARSAALWAAGFLCVAALCAASSVAANAVGVARGAAPAPGVGAAAVVTVATFVAAALSAVFAALSRPALAGGLTAGYGAVSVGLVALDIELVRSPIDANRLEYFRPTTAEALEPGLGSYLVVAAHVLAVVGGLCGIRAVDRASFGDGHGHSERADLVGRAAAVRIGGVLSVAAVVAAVVAAASMLAPAYVSTDSIVLVPAVVDASPSTAIGSGLVALAVVVVVAAALASISVQVAAGALASAGLAVLGVSATRVVAGSASGPEIDASVGSWLGAGAGVVLLAVGVLALPSSTRRDHRDTQTRERTDSAGPGQSMRWHVAAGISGAASGVLLCVGGLLPVLAVPDGLPDPTILATRVAVVAGFLMVVVSVPMFFSLFAAAARPALGVVAVAGVMAGTGVLQSVVIATDIDGIAVGSGGIVTVLGVLAAVACGACVLFAGGAERDDVDTSDLASHRTTATIAGVGALLAAVGLTLPLYTGVDATAASVLELPWGWDTWGQVALAATLLVSAAVASRSRPARGASLLAGGVVAMVVYLLGWPLTQERVADATVGSGLVVGAAGLVVLAVAATVSARRRNE